MTPTKSVHHRSTRRGGGIVREAVDSQIRGLQECEINTVANGSSKKSWDQVAIDIELLDEHVLKGTNSSYDW
jgi:hypothetical protein